MFSIQMKFQLYWTLLCGFLLNYFTSLLLLLLCEQLSQGVMMVYLLFDCLYIDFSSFSGDKGFKVTTNSKVWVYDENKKACFLRNSFMKENVEMVHS